MPLVRDDHVVKQIRAGSFPPSVEQHGSATTAKGRASWLASDVPRPALEKEMQAQPTRSCQREAGAADVPLAPATCAGQAKKKRRVRPKKANKNQPAFDLEAELKRVLGVDLTRIDGIDVVTAQTVYAELGADLGAAFPTEDHFASWLMLAPKRDLSGGRVIRHYSLHSRNRVAQTLRMAAESLHDSRSHLGARFRALRGRRCGVKAVKAMARYLACVIYRMLTKGEAGSIAALPTSNKNDKNASSITSNVERLLWECNSLLQTRLETPNPKCGYAVKISYRRESSLAHHHRSQGTMSALSR
jgi:hypothetical protein